MPWASAGSDGGEAAPLGSVSATARDFVGPSGGTWVKLMSEEHQQCLVRSRAEPTWAGWSRAGCLSAQELLQLGHGFPWKGWRWEEPRAGFFIFHLCSLPSSCQQDECPGRNDSGTALCDCSPRGWVQPPSSWEGLLRQESGEEGRCVPSPRACLCRSTRVKAPGGISRGWWSVEMALHQYSSVSKTGTSSKHNSISAHQ